METPQNVDIDLKDVHELIGSLHLQLFLTQKKLAESRRELSELKAKPSQFTTKE